MPELILRALLWPFLLVRRALVGASELFGPPLGAMVARRPAAMVAATLGSALGLMVVINALALQTERHPAPMFDVVAREPATETTAALPKPSQRVAPPPARAPIVEGVPREMLTREIQRDLAGRGYYTGPIDGRTGPLLTRAIRDFERAAKRPETGEASEDVLAALGATDVSLKNEMRDLFRTHAPADAEGRRVQAVQRALNKAGYGPLLEDGQFGPSTRQAIERFEKDRRLPVSGEAKGRTIKTLAAASGIAIE